MGVCYRNQHQIEKENRLVKRKKRNDRIKRKMFIRTVLPSFLCALFALPILGFSNMSLAADESVAANQASVVSENIAAVNINIADAESIAETLKGVGIKKAQAIVTWREANGKFTSADQLLEIKGIGEKILTVNEAKISL